MPLDLPEPDKYQLARSPLALVVCQIQYEEILSVSDARFLLQFHQALGGRDGKYPLVDRLQEQQLSVGFGPAGPQSTASQLQTGAQVLSQDKRWTISVLPTSVAIQTTKYSTWSGEFRERLHEVLDIVGELVSPHTEQRLGLRYVDRIADPSFSTPQNWRGYIVDELLGPILHERLGPAITSSQQQINIDADEDIRCGLRHGFHADTARNGALTYTLDFDVYREGVRAFDTSDIKAAVDTFNRLALQLFQQTVTPRMLEFLRS